MATPRMTRRLLGVISKRFPPLRLEDLTDTRDRKGRRHASIVPAGRLMLVGMMAGCKGLAEVEDLNVDMSMATRKLLGLPQRIADTTCRDTLLRLVFDELRQVLHRSVNSPCWRRRRSESGAPARPTGPSTVRGPRRGAGTSDCRSPWTPSP